ncbi:hypothetical protein LH612_34640 [Klebsiella pneumoniae]|nr:hypothetical protein [Klebsiella pneumoniae]
MDDDFAPVATSTPVTVLQQQVVDVAEVFFASGVGVDLASAFDPLDLGPGLERQRPGDVAVLLAWPEADISGATR